MNLATERVTHALTLMVPLRNKNELKTTRPRHCSVVEIDYTPLPTLVANICRQSSVADPRRLSRIPDPNFFHPDPRSRIQGQKDSRLRIHIRIEVF
jgi:hypothetical protein